MHLAALEDGLRRPRRCSRWLRRVRPTGDAAAAGGRRGARGEHPAVGGDGFGVDARARAALAGSDPRVSQDAGARVAPGTRQGGRPRRRSDATRRARSWSPSCRRRRAGRGRLRDGERTQLGRRAAAPLARRPAPSARAGRRGARDRRRARDHRRGGRRAGQRHRPQLVLVGRTLRAPEPPRPPHGRRRPSSEGD